MHVFMDDEDGYRQWLEQNPQGAYVLNFGRRMSERDYRMLHRSGCHSIRGDPPAGDYWTHHYGKACSADRQHLETFAEELLGGPVTECRQPSCWG